MRNTERQFFVYDLEVYARKAGAELPSLASLVALWKRESDADRAFTPIRSGTATLLLGQVAVDSTNNTATFLIKVSDTMSPNSVYSDPVAGTYVEHTKTGTVGGELGIHVLVSTLPERGFTNRYTCIIEKLPYLRPDHVHRILSHVVREEFTTNATSFQYPHPGGERDENGHAKMERARPYLRLEGRPSNRFQTEVNTGRLNGVTLIRSEGSTPISGTQFLKRSEMTLKLSVDHGHTPANVWATVRRVASQNASRFPQAAVSFTLPGRGKAVTVKVDSATGAPLEDLYIQSFDIKNITPFLADSAQRIVAHFEQRAKAQLLSERTV